MGSEPLSFESVFDKAEHADIWITNGSIMTLNQLLEENHHYQKFDAYQKSEVYTFESQKGETGGTVYYESAPSRPDLVLKDYIKIHLRTQKFPVVCRMTMKSIEEKLPSTEFIRVHKSFIVSLSKMESIRSQKIKIGENHIPISESYSEHFYQIIGYQKQ